MATIKELEAKIEDLQRRLNGVTDVYASLLMRIARHEIISIPAPGRYRFYIHSDGNPADDSTRFRIGYKFEGDL